MKKVSPREALMHLVQLLAIEKEEDHKQYLEQFERCSIAERKRNGVTWHPIVIRSEEIGPGDNLILEIERTNSSGEAHQFSTGKVVSLFTTSGHAREGEELQGTVKQVIGDKMRIALNADDLPGWIDSGKLGVNLLFDENSYREMLIAMQKVMDAERSRLAQLRDVLYGIREPETEKPEDFREHASLNKSQNEALCLIASAKDVAIIHGPPGTGKTTTLVQAIRQTLMREKQVLVCSPSNTAVDLLTEKLVREGINVLRLGHPARVSDEVMNNTLDVRVTNHASYKELKQFRKKAEEYFRLASQYKRSFGSSERMQRNLLYSEARSILKEASQLEDYIYWEQFETAQVIACTPVVSASRQLRDMRFSTVFIDEAAQALEPMCWIPIVRADRVVFAGDHCQLPPTVKSKKAAADGLSETLFEKAIEWQPQSSVMLNTQYRMHQQIMEFSNRRFYHGGLIADASVKDNLLSFDENETLLCRAFELLDTAGCGFEEKQNPETLSYSNPEEADLLIRYLKKLLAEYDQRNDEPLTVGVIAPYRGQVEMLEQKVLTDETLSASRHKIAVKTVDGFQGQERDIICISLVRCNPEGEIGFLADIRRMNVAMTRAKRKLVVCGDSATLSQHSFYKAFLDYVDECNAYRSAWEILYEG